MRSFVLRVVAAPRTLQFLREPPPERSQGLLRPEPVRRTDACRWPPSGRRSYEDGGTITMLALSWNESSSGPTCGLAALLHHQCPALHVYATREGVGANSDTKCTTPGVRGRGNLGHFWFLPTAKQTGTDACPDHPARTIRDLRPEAIRAVAACDLTRAVALPFHHLA